MKPFSGWMVMLCHNFRNAPKWNGGLFSCISNLAAIDLFFKKRVLKLQSLLE